MMGKLWVSYSYILYSLPLFELMIKLQLTLIKLDANIQILVIG